MKVYQVQVSVSHVVVVDARSIEEAEELAYDQFQDDEGLWDDVDFWTVELED